MLRSAAAALLISTALTGCFATRVRNDARTPKPEPMTEEPQSLGLLELLAELVNLFPPATNDPSANPTADPFDWGSLFPDAGAGGGGWPWTLGDAGAGPDPDTLPGLDAGVPQWIPPWQRDGGWDPFAPFRRDGGLPFSLPDAQFPRPDAGAAASEDAGVPFSDAGSNAAGPSDAEPSDAGLSDAGLSDAEPSDAEPSDAGDDLADLVPIEGP